MNPLARKLENFTELSPEDRRFLDSVIADPRQMEARTDLIREGEAPDDVHLVLDGFAFRYKLLPDGSRQILAYLVPGDFCDLHVFILHEMDHAISTLTPCSIVKISRRKVLEMTERPAIARGLWWATLVDEAILREWLVNMGRRSAEERVAHFLCELLMRLRSVGLADSRCELPITQSELGDTLGLSTVYVNRTLQDLRARGLITLSNRTLTVSNVPRLIEFSGFNANYLHLKERRGDVVLRTT